MIFARWAFDKLSEGALMNVAVMRGKWFIPLLHRKIKVSHDYGIMFITYLTNLLVEVIIGLYCLGWKSVYEGSRKFRTAFIL